MRCVPALLDRSAGSSHLRCCDAQVSRGSSRDVAAVGLVVVDIPSAEIARLARAGETNRRLVAQSGEFVWWRDIQRTAQWFPVLIPAEHKAQLLRTLDGLHVSPRALFPDDESLHVDFDAWTAGGNPLRPALRNGYRWTWPGAENAAYAQVVPL